MMSPTTLRPRPGEFVEARTKHVKAARDDNDRTLAAEIGKLRKPTTVGWLVNLISRDAPEDLDALLALGESLRDAQRHLSGPDLRRLTTQRAAGGAESRPQIR